MRAGNNYRGLYNIGLKSLGAAKKKHAGESTKPHQLELEVQHEAAIDRSRAHCPLLSHLHALLSPLHIKRLTMLLAIADVRLDGVLAYGERTVDMGRGYFMMDSPGNDLESIAGQVRRGLQARSHSNLAQRDSMDCGSASHHQRHAVVLGAFTLNTVLYEAPHPRFPHLSLAAVTLIRRLRRAAT